MPLSIYIVNGFKKNKELTEFLQGMANRLSIGHFRYGDIKATDCYMSRLGKEYEKYKKTGNREHLLNIANYAFLESVAPEHFDSNFDNTVESVTRKKGQ